MLLGDLSDVAAAAGDVTHAVHLRGASASLQAGTGAGLEEVGMQSMGGRLQQLGDDEDLRRAFDEGRRMSRNEAIDYALGRWEPVRDQTV